MSGPTGGYTKSETYRSPSYATAKGSDRKRLLEETEERVEALRANVDENRARREAMDATRYDPWREYEAGMVRLKVTSPPKGVDTVYVVMVDRSSSNQTIADHIQGASNYTMANMRTLHPNTAAIIFVYVSDHCDGDQWYQEIDYVQANDEGERILKSSHLQIKFASGGDIPEAFECALPRVCEFNFDGIKNKHLILVTDSVAHGMGYRRGDDGCPRQGDWRAAVKKVYRTFDSFEVIGCGDDPDMAELQKQFISLEHPERLQNDFISLAYIRNVQHRLGIVLNTVFFLIARHRGLQTVEGFISRLYQKWLAEPLPGIQETDRAAKEALIRFAKYLPGSEDEITRMYSRALVTPIEEVRRLIAIGASKL